MFERRVVGELIAIDFPAPRYTLPALELFFAAETGPETTAPALTRNIIRK
jgi:hypothetical protein